MARDFLIPLAAVVTAMLWLAPGAQARTPCPSEQVALTAQSTAQVSEALVCLTNQIRGHYGLPALRRDARLDAAAQGHSEDMDRRNFFSHTTPDGLTSAARAAAQGYTGRGTGENIAFGYPTARAVVLAWMQSSGHCRNILSEATDIGVGLSASSKTYYTQNFGNFTARVDLGSRDNCPHPIDLDALGDAPAGGNATASTATAEKAGYGDRGEAPASEDIPIAASLSALKLSRSRFRPGGTATSITYTLSADARIVFRIQRERRGQRCETQTPPNGSRRAKGSRKTCVRYETMRGSFAHEGVPGANSLKFAGRLRGKKLKAGRYRLQALAVGAAPVSVPFELTRGR